MEIAGRLRSGSSKGAPITDDDGRIHWGDGALRLAISIDARGPVTVDHLHFASHTAAEPASPSGIPLVELSYEREGRPYESPSAQHRGKAGSARLRYLRHEQTTGTDGSARLIVTQRDAVRDLEVQSHFERLADVSCVRTWTTVTNQGSEPVTLDFVSTFCLSNIPATGGGSLTDAINIHYARNAWASELRWFSRTPEELGVIDVGKANTDVGGSTSRGRFALHSMGSWSTGDYLPMGIVTDQETGWCCAWQIEHNGGWHWELGDYRGRLYVIGTGPTDQEHHWRHTLQPGEEFTTVPAALTSSCDGFEGAVARLTTYRRRIRRPNRDNEELPVVFNDYMNCLMGEPTTSRLLPLVDVAAEVGAEYFVIDAGWYSGWEPWWAGVGEWLPSEVRFPHGLCEVTDRIEACGMRTGLWLEPEVIGVQSPVAERLPDSSFFYRNGARVAEHGRYHLDLRDDAARDHLDAVVDRLVRDFRVEYFKFDYNVNIGLGTDRCAASVGDGLLGHNRAYLGWLDTLFERHPSLVIENCASGGLRMDYALLRRLSIQSTSDQQDPICYAAIAASAPTAIAPEQAAVWAYPSPDYTDEMNAFTMVNALLQRIHLSGRIDLLDKHQRAQVCQSLDVYKAIRGDIPQAVPHWPLGLPRWSAEWTSLALEAPERVLVSVWRRYGMRTQIDIPLPWWHGGPARLEVLSPTFTDTDCSWDPETKQLSVYLPEAPSARLFSLTPA